MLLNAQQRNEKNKGLKGCSSYFECTEKDANLKRRNVAVMKAFLGISKNGKTSVTISYETLSEKSSYGRTQTMLAVNELVSMGYISKKQVGGKHQHDANIYLVNIPREYKKWLTLPMQRPIINKLKKSSEYTSSQKIKMAMRTLVEEGVVGDAEMNHAVKQTSLRKVKAKLADDHGLNTLLKKSKVNYAINKVNEELMATLKTS